MKVRWVSNIGSISLSVLLFASTFIIVINSTTYADAEDAPVNTSPSSTGSDEVAAASGSNRFVVWSDKTPGNFDILFRRSTDGGATWQPTVNLSNNPGTSSYPLIAVSGSIVYVVWQDETPGNSEIFFRRSTDNGATWQLAINLSNNPGGSFYPQMVASGSNVYVAWDQRGAGGNLSDVFFRRSTDSGATWKFFKNLSSTGISDAPQIAISGTNVYVVWDNYPGYEVFFRRSTDNGATWKTAVNLSNNAGPSAIPLIAASGSNVYVAWNDQTPGLADVFFKRSTDNGATWKTTKNLSSDAPHSFPRQIAVSGSNVYVVWLESVSQYYDIIFRRSLDNGATWSAKVVINSEVVQIGAPISVVASGSNVYVVWSTDPPGAPLSDVLFRRSTDNGATWKSIVNISNNPSASGGPVLAVSGSNLYLAWINQGGVGGNLDIFFRRSTDNGATWQPNVNLSSNAGLSRDVQVGA